jgi:hypothetical protein
MLRGNYKGITYKEANQSKEEILIQGMIGGPSEKAFKVLVSRKNAEFFPIDKTEISNVRKIFFPHLPGVRGRTVRKSPDPVVES